MPQFSNSDKQEHGKNAKSALESILLECKNYAYIKEIIKDYRCGYAEYDNAQFYCNFVIVFQDDTKWIVNITTSLLKIGFILKALFISFLISSTE